MSTFLINHETPNSINGMEINESVRRQLSYRKHKVLSLKIEIDEPDYDEEGNLIHKEDEDYDEDFYAYRDAIFAVELLDQAYDNPKVYTGEYSPGELKTIKLEKERIELEKKQQEVLTQSNIEADLVKFLNVDFIDKEASENDDQEDGSEKHGLSIDFDN